MGLRCDTPTVGLAHPTGVREGQLPEPHEALKTMPPSMSSRSRRDGFGYSAGGAGEVRVQTCIAAGSRLAHAKYGMAVSGTRRPTAGGAASTVW